MHPSFRHVFGGEEITPEPPAVILHFGAHSSSFQVSGQFQPSKNILPNLYGKWMAMKRACNNCNWTRFSNYVRSGTIEWTVLQLKVGQEKIEMFSWTYTLVIIFREVDRDNLHSFLFRTSSFWKRILVIFRTRDGLEIVQCLTQI